MMLRQQYTWTFQIHNSSTTVAIKGSFQHPLIAHAEADAYQGLLLFHDQHTTWRSLVKAAGTIDACKACTRSSAHHLNRRYPGILDAISRLRPLPFGRQTSSSIIVSDSICLHACTIFIRALAFVHTTFAITATSMEASQETSAQADMPSRASLQCPVSMKGTVDQSVKL
jgi:hypothetical protein